MYNQADGAIGHKTVMEEFEDLQTCYDRINEDVKKYNQIDNQFISAEKEIHPTFVLIGGAALFAYAHTQDVSGEQLQEFLPDDFDTDHDLYMSPRIDDFENFKNIPAFRFNLMRDTKFGIQNYWVSEDRPIPGDTSVDDRLDREYIEIFYNFGKLQCREPETGQVIDCHLEREIQEGGHKVIYDDEITVIVPTLETLRMTEPELDAKESRHIGIAEEILEG
jgi:hypothetical protein